jgi:hypothetical protein
MLLLYIFALATDFEDKDMDYMGLSYNEYVYAGYIPFIFSVLLGIVMSVYNAINIFGYGTFWERVREHNIVFAFIIVAILLLSIIQAFMVYEDKEAIRRKVWLSIYYCFVGIIGGFLTSVVLLALFLYLLGKDFAVSREVNSFKLDDGTEEEEMRDLITGKDSSRLNATDGSGRRFRRIGNEAIEE